ncbi:MAG: 16S rRNA (cytidine(1402)-2'-O)-methyltransferase [Deltaproteobacteria bacterium]|nr:16S rRNA (cytidine(1402)-2'-O)-methyltransferase [Deltaproteobacteria bacterium]
MKALTPALYVVATPIGNLQDLGARAAQVLAEADVIACEDTRTSAPLLSHAGARGRRVALHDHNEDRAADALLDEVAAGRVVALISDAGTPLLSDPGFPVVRRAAERGLPVVSVPGPSALLAALCVAGLPTARFFFAGFLPDRPARRLALLDELSALAATLVFYAPAREVPAALAALREGLGDRRAAVCRELTKLHEEVRRGTLAELAAAEHVLLGEAVIVVEGAPEAAADADALEAAVRAGLAAGEPPSALARRLAKEHRVARSSVYERIVALRPRDGGG